MITGGSAMSARYTPNSLRYPLVGSLPGLDHLQLHTQHYPTFLSVKRNDGEPMRSQTLSVIVRLLAVSTTS